MNPWIERLGYAASSLAVAPSIQTEAAAPVVAAPSETAYQSKEQPHPSGKAAPKRQKKTGAKAQGPAI